MLETGPRFKSFSQFSPDWLKYPKSWYYFLNYLENWTTISRILSNFLLHRWKSLSPSAWAKNLSNWVRSLHDLVTFLSPSCSVGRCSVLARKHTRANSNLPCSAQLTSRLGYQERHHLLFGGEYLNVSPNRRCIIRVLSLQV